MNKFLYDKFGTFKIKVILWSTFLIGLILKFCLAANFASEYLTKLFIPFLNFYVDSGFANPYQHYYNLQIYDAFPYPPLMLWIMSFAKLIFSKICGFSNDFDLIVYRIPLLLADVSILLVLIRWLKTENKKILYYYWFSPIIIFVNYIHGQLDVIPIAFLISSLYFLFKEKHITAFFILGLALATKTNILITVPFFVIYLLRSRQTNFLKSFFSILVCVTVFLVLNMPYLFNDAFRQMVFFNTQQTKVFDLSYHFTNDLSFYIIPALYLMLLLTSFQFRIINRDVFVMFLGFTFGVMLIFIPPMPGWYFWILPFFIYFYIKESEGILVFFLLNIFYFMYFFYSAFNLSQSLVFTVLQTTLILNCIQIYKTGVKANLDYKIKSKPYLIGVAGDSGAGKTTYSNLLLSIFGKKNTTIVRGDDMHKYERGHEMWNMVTHLNPKANHLHEEMNNALLLKQGQKVYRRLYDHSQGVFTLPKEIQSNKLIVFEGLHAFYLSKMQELLDLKVFIKPDESLRKAWKIERDTIQRNHKKEKVLEQLENRKEDSKKFIQRQEKFADIVISFSSIDQHELKFIFSNQFNVDSLIEALEICETLKINHYFEDEKQFLIFNGEVNKNIIEFLFYRLVPELDEVINIEPELESGFNGLIQLISTYCIFEKMRLEN